MNSELPNQHAGRRRLIEWLVFYVALAAVLGAVGWWASHQLGEEELPAGHVTVSVGKQHYKLGETVNFTVTNNFPVPISVNNFCPNEPLNVYRWDGRNWARIHQTSDISACAGQQRQIIIPAEHSMTYSYKNWPGLFKQPGRYRIVAAIEHYEGLPFQDFEILKPPIVKVKKVIAPTRPTTSPAPAPTTNEREHEDENETETETETDN